jgi:hypothetical protein
MSNNVALALVFICQNDNRIQLIVSCKWALKFFSPHELHVWERHEPFVLNCDPSKLCQLDGNIWNMGHRIEILVKRQSLTLFSFTVGTKVSLISPIFLAKAECMRCLFRVFILNTTGMVFFDFDLIFEGNFGLVFPASTRHVDFLEIYVSFFTILPFCKQNEL